MNCQPTENAETDVLLGRSSDVARFAGEIAAIPLATLEAQISRLVGENGGDALSRYVFLVALDVAGSQVARFLRTIGADQQLIEDAIEAAFARLAELEQGPASPEASFRQRLFWGLLRSMQAEMAERYADEFNAARPLPRGAGYAAIARARELLGRNPPPGAGDPPSG